MKRVLVTGASGFVGWHCLAPLLARGYEVHAVSTGARQDPDIRWHQANLLDPIQTASLLAEVRPTHLLHLAWVVTPEGYRMSPLNWQWVDASLKLLEAFGDNGGERVVMGGTCAEYAPTLLPCQETATPLAPRTIYGACKAAVSVLLPVFAGQYGVCSAAWARLFYLYGPREQPTRLVASAIRALIHNEPMPCSYGEQIRDFLHVEDAADGLLALLDSPVTGAVNVASGQPIALRALLASIGSITDRQHLLQFGARPASPHESPMLVADVTRLNREVGWRPTTTLDEGLRRTVEWWRQEVVHGA